MPSSTVSLEPLSSPSPSPTPPPPDTRGSTSNNSGAGAGLDSGSELSELTEDEPENAKADREDGRRQTKRKKRGGMIPPSMWEWAYGANKKKDPRNKTAEEEEEEEEQSDPRRALEEEEDDDRGSRSRSNTTPPPDRRRRRPNGGASAVVHSDDDLDREHDPDDDAASADEASAPHPPDRITNDPDYASEDEDGVPAERADAVVSREPAGGVKADEASDDENVEDDPEAAQADEDPPDVDDLANDNAALASDDEAIVTAAPSTAPPSATPSIPSAPPPIAVNRDNDPHTTLMDVDETAPVPAQVSPIIAAAAASSIMAGAEVVDPPSPSPSASSASARQQSRSPSRSPSPEQISDREVEPKRTTAKTRAKPRSGRATRNRASRRKPKGDPDQEVEAEPAPDPEPEDADDLDEGDIDSPEMDMELELQPAHRAEALDVLANIELKYALLRENLYVEKMEALSWEEALVNNGVHPEMLHLQTELSNRRDKRLELARLRRDYEVANVTKRRKLDEDGVWSWWKLRRDELQTDMISEAHRKRRQLDRERRALERPQPIRRIPSPPREIGAPPTLRDLVKASPFDSPDSLRRPGSSNALAYPQLSTLAPAEIAGDVEFLFGHRRNAGMVVNGLYGFPGIPPVFDQYNVGMPMLDGPGAPNRFLPHIPFQQGAMPPQAVPPPPPPQAYHNLAPPPPRLQHHHSAPSSSIPMAHPQMMIDQDFPGNGHRSGAGATHPPSQMPQYQQAGPSSRNRRSLSPVPVHHMSNGSSAIVPSGTSSKSSRGGAGGSSAAVHSTEMKRGGSQLRGMDAEAAIMEKERERRFIEREREEQRHREMEREWQYRQQQQREQEHFEREMERSNHPAHSQRAPSHSHPHPHGQPGPGTHGHPSHHHHHHHHVVHHHHHAGSANGLGPGVSGQPQSTFPRDASNGIGPGVGSPRIPRDAESQRGHAVPVEGNDDQFPPHSDGGRDRARGPLGPSAHERQNPSFVSPPMHSSQSVFPPSPRTTQGLSTAPASVAPSRRGSWSAPDGAPLPRPPSSSSAQLPLPVSQRLPVSALPGRPPQLSPNQPHRSPMMSPPRNSEIRLPPLSPPQPSMMRSPPRNSQALPGLPPSGSHSKPVSPKVSRRQTPPPPLSRPRSPSTRERSLSGVAAPSIPPAQKPSRMSPVNIFPASVSQPTPLPTSRLPNVGVDPEANLPPKVNAVPID